VAVVRQPDWQERVLRIRFVGHWRRRAGRHQSFFDPACLIRYVITVEALKKGLETARPTCSLYNPVNSSKDVWQLLRPGAAHAMNRTRDALNRAYAHIVADFLFSAGGSRTLKDRMVQNMGFERLETASLIIPSGPAAFWRHGVHEYSGGAASFPPASLNAISTCRRLTRNAARN
jgi:hypothetical protein